MSRTLGVCKLAIVASFVFLSLVPSLATAQEAASIIGQVKDSDGGVLPGVTVTATSPALQVREITTVTDADGEYRLPALPGGLYQVTYALQGFTTLRRDDIRLGTGFVAKIDVALSIGALNETITVTGQAPLVDVTSTTTGTQLTREVLEQIPTARVGVGSLLVTAPGVRPLQDVGGSNALSVPVFRAFGQQGESWQLLEGVSTNQARAPSGFGNYFDFAVVAEGNVRTMGNNAEVPFRGIFLDQVVKSGGNQFHGSGYFTWTNHNLVSNNVTDELKAQGINQAPKVNVRRDMTGDVGGRIIRDQLWFYWATSQNHHNADVLGCYQDDKVTPCYRRQIGTYHTGKINYQMTGANKLIFFFQQGNKRDLTGTSTLVGWEGRREQDHNMFTFKVEDQTVFGQALVTSFQVGRFYYEGPYRNASGGTPTIETTTGVRTGSAVGATDTGTHVGSFDWQGRGTATLYKPDLFFGNHELKAGFDATFFDLNLMAVSLAIENPGEGIVFPSKDYQLQFTNGVPTQIAFRNAPVDPHTKSQWVGTYIQDNWVIGRRFTVNLGLRYQHDNAFVPEQCRPVSTSFPTLFPAQCFDRVQFMVHNDFAPRAHVAWDLGGNGTTVVKGGWSRFKERRSTEPEVAGANQAILQSWLFRWRDLNENRDYDPGEVLLDKNGADFISVSPVSGSVPNLVDEKQPKSDELMLSMERQLTANTAVRVTGVYSRNSDRKALSNRLRPYSVHNIPITNRDPGRDGALNTADDPGTSITYYDYSTAYRGAAFQEAYTINLDDLDATYKSYELALSRRMANRFMFQASYTSSRFDDPYPVNSVAPPVYNPNTFINVANDGNEWTGKLSGAFQLPAGITASALFDSRSGSYYARTAVFRGGVSIPQITLNVEPATANKLPTVNRLDIRFDKRFQVAGGHSFSVRTNLYNALNSSVMTGIENRSGAAFGRATSILDARIIDIGGTYSF
jgi:hypothetical protein